MGDNTVRNVLTHSLASAAIALAFSAAPATAADLGGDCCADLEERVAVLEATTARKGNRKVSLVISGQVNKALMIWDDEQDSDAYVVDNTNSNTRIRFKGNAKINHDWSAGYYIEFNINSAASIAVSQADDDGSASIGLRQSNMYVASKSLGKLSWGQMSSSTDDLVFAGRVVGNSVVNGAGDPLIGAGLFVNNGVNVATIGHLTRGASIADFTTRRNMIRYDTPTIGGFVLSAAWGEDDFWDVALRYAGEFGQIKVKAAVGYSEESEEDGAAINAGRGITEEEAFHVTAGIIHTPTGLFVQAWYSEFSYDQTAAEIAADGALSDAEAWNVEVGIKQKWNSLGATAIYGAYTECEDCFAKAAAINALVANTGTTEYTSYEVGIVQYVDAAALELYAAYRVMETEIDGVDQNDIDLITIGGRIKF